MPDLTYRTIQANTVRKANQCPTCGQLLPSGWTSSRPSVLKAGDLILNPSTHDVTRRGKDIVLSQKEFQLLEFLMRREGQIVPRDMLAHSAWQSNGDVSQNLIDVSIYQLRKKIDRDHDVKLIKTVRNVGYAIRDPRA